MKYAHPNFYGGKYNDNTKIFRYLMMPTLGSCSYNQSKPRLSFENVLEILYSLRVKEVYRE